MYALRRPERSAATTASSSTMPSREKLSSTAPALTAASRGPFTSLRVAATSGTCNVTKSAVRSSSSMLPARFTFEGSRHAASTVISGSKPTTFMPSLIAVSATRLPMAPSPMIPSVRLRQLDAGELLLAVLDLALEIGSGGIESCDVAERRNEVASRHQQRRQHQLLHRIGVGARRIEHRHAARGHRRDRNIVGARAGAADRLHACGYCHRLHVVRAHEDGIGMLDRLADLVARGRQAVQTLARDLVEHEHPILRWIVHACVRSKSRM